MRKKWTTWLATSALVLLVGSGITAVHAGAADAGQKDFPFPYRERERRGFTGWEIVAVPTATVANNTQRTAECPRGKRVTGGGANATGTTPILLGSFPTPDGRGWIGVGRSETTATVGIAVWAVCAKVTI
jgi:hypothetical protein